MVGPTAPIAGAGRGATSGKARADVVGETLAGLVGLIFGVVCGIGGLLIYLKIRLRTARDQAEAILAEGRRQAEDVRKEAEYLAKEEALRRRVVLDNEAEEARKGFREQEKRLEKRGDLLDQKLEMITKKEREFETVQRYLTERQEDLDRRSQEVKNLLAEQRNALHRITGMGPDEARTLLMGRLEEDLKHEIGGLILKHEQALRETSAQKAREVLATAIQRYAAG